ncbi:MAG: ribosomal RNA small subunit methyltransferase A [Candidatus Vogelbacteria bacterium]|nr:ribosomal RNA small subunit methyltransferase A [Candidatus Vogelbacteria bacterium]
MRAKKSLGQNFLRLPTVFVTMIEAARLKEGETVLEVGPGLGHLTDALLAAGARVVAVEKDDRLIGRLAEKFAAAIKNKQLELIHADILDFSLQANKLKSYKLIANPPYYITGRLLRRFLASDQPPTLAVLMLQKEVAERIVTKNGKESLLSISVKVYGEPRYIQTIPAKYFSPQPKVDSAIVLINKISKDNFRTVNEKKFFTLLKHGFAGKRKMLKNNLALPETVLAACQTEPTTRAENLTLDQWLCLVKYC